MHYIIRPTTDKEHKAQMPYVTSSMIEAVNTCPRFGIIHNVLGKRFVTGYRQMALEAGSLMHDVFALLNFLQVGVVQGLRDHMHYHASQLFEKERWDYIWHEGIFKLKPDEKLEIDNINYIERMVYAVIGTSDFYDDPNDKNRTVTKLEHCALELLQYWLLNLADFPIYISDTKDCKKPIGVEMSLDCVFEIGRNEIIDDEDAQGVTSERVVTDRLRCIGLADAVYQNPETSKITLGEYKTASSMNDAWRMAFDTRHQITLYNALLQAYFGYQEEFNTILIGSAIPVRTTSAPVQHFKVDRDQENVQQMLNTFLFSRNLINRYENDPLSTPMFTHSCNRYFRPCSLLDLCTSLKEDQEIMLSQMETETVLSPSEQKALLRNM